MSLRTPLSVTPHLYMGDSTGRPLDMGTVYFGEQDKDPEFYPINLFSDDSLTLPLAQPVHTKGGYLYDKGDIVEPHAKEIIYSVKVLDSYGRKVFYKGAMMRNSWNDDVIEQINQAIVDSQQDVAASAASAVQDAINNTAIEGGVLADTFVTATANGVGTIARTQRDINAESVSIHSFGECGNGAEDTVVFNLAMSTLSDLAKADGKPRVLRLIAGKTYILRNAFLKPLVDLVCVDGIATLKRIDVPVGTAETSSKWWRILDTARSSWDSDACYEYRSNIKNILFDGNWNNAQWTRGSYNQEQASSLMIYGSNQTDINKRVRFHLDNVRFKDSVSDGLHVQVNADVTAVNCYAENCFRGGLTLTGGNTVVNIKNWRAENAKLDAEIDASGSNGSRTVHFIFDGYYQDFNSEPHPDCKQGMDFTNVGNNGILDYINVHVGRAPASWFISSTSNQKPLRYSITNSSFVLGRGTPAYNPSNGVIQNTSFLIDNREANATDKKAGGIYFYMNYAGYAQDEKTEFVFKDVSFDVMDKSPERALASPLIELSAQPKTSKASIVFDGLKTNSIKPTVALISIPLGGKATFDNVTTAATKFMGLNGTYLEGANNLDVKVGKLNFESQLDFFMQVYSSATGEAGYKPAFENKLEFKEGFRIDAANNKFLSAGVYTGNVQVLKGYRTIVGDMPPTTTTGGYKNDIYTLTVKTIGKPYEWAATRTQLATGSGGAVWQATKWLTGSFATVDLPVLTAFDVGAQNIDTTLNKLVTWSGTAWV